MSEDSEVDALEDGRPLLKAFVKIKDAKMRLTLAAFVQNIAAADRGNIATASPASSDDC
jgi:hypothetical protein